MIMGNIFTKIEMLLYITKFTTHVLRAPSPTERTVNIKAT